jgi:threonine dehydratase
MDILMITLQQIQDAKRTINGSVRRTPLIRSSFLSELCHGDFFLKLENLQLTNAFKIRGAVNKIQHMSSEELKRGIVTASAGNHAQGVAVAAEKLGLKLDVKIVVPLNTPRIKIEKIKKHNVNLICFGNIYDEAEQHAKEISQETGATYISPYNDELIIAGQGTIGLEILEDMPNVDRILVPVGGGGLISGISLAARNIKPDVEIFGVQSEASPSMHSSLKAGELVTVEVRESLADGLSGNIEAGSITFQIMRRNVDDLILVKEESIRKAIYLLWKKDGQIVEGAAATVVSALLENPQPFSSKRTVAVITGGNIEDSVLNEILASEMKM